MFAENVSGVHRQKRNVLSSRLKQLRLASNKCCVVLHAACQCDKLTETDWCPYKITTRTRGLVCKPTDAF